MSANESEENETVGPKVGIKLNKDQADLIIQRHFPHLSATRISHVDRGYNNRIYIVTTSDNNEFIIRLGGRFWTRYKTENEVVALLSLAELCKSLPVPKIFGFCTDRSKSGIGSEYILMQKMDGEPLDYIWDRLELKNKMYIATQIATLFSKIQAIRFPKIGSFQFESDEIGNSHGMGINLETDVEAGKVFRVGRGVEFDGGPLTITCKMATEEYTD